jgi:hypothetical protein
MRKKFFALCGAVVLSACFAFAFVGCGGTSAGTDDLTGDDKNQTKQEFASGTGTESDPYVISTDEHWTNVANHLSAYYELKNDIYLEDLGTIKPIGSSDEPFEGVIDGKNFTVSNATISNNDECGLFGCVSGATIKNLNFKDSSISMNVTGDGAYAGSFAANVKKGSLIENCHTDNIAMTETAHGDFLGYPKFYTAGFVGILQSASKIIYCSCNVISNAKGNRSIYLAGFVGKMSGGEIDACYCAGSFDANATATGGGTPSNRIGGFVYTFNAGKITNVYTETVFNYAGYVGMITYENMDELDYILSFIEFEHTSKDVGTKLYYKADIVNNSIEGIGCQYYSPDIISSSNSILDKEYWSNNKVWKKGKIHPELVSYEEYVALQV